MKPSLLVISEEPALAETLASELPDLSISGVTPADANQHIHNENFRLIIIDNATHYTTDTETRNSIKLVRPIRLSDAIYTIRQQVKSKTASEESEIIPGYLFLPSDRVIQDDAGGTRIALTDKEVNLLQELTKQRSAPLSRDTLLKNIWGYGDDINTHTLETHIYRLRSKLKQLNEAIDIVFSEEGGYQIR